MSTRNKIVIVLMAVVAFITGAFINSARVSDQIDAQALLSAELTQVVNGETEAQYSPETIKSKLGDKLTLVNFWASWCAPCREEMPLFQSMYDAANTQGFQVIGVAIDSPEKARPMLDSMGIDYPILYAEKTGMKVMEMSGNPQGLLPYTLLLNSKGEIIEQVLGVIHAPQITQWLNNAAITIE